MYVTMFMMNIAHDQYSRYVRVSCMLGKETNVTRHVSVWFCIWRCIHSDASSLIEVPYGSGTVT